MLPWLLIAVPIWFNLFYGLLAWRFSYPGILRQPTDVILTRFREGGSGLILLWWLFALGALAFIPIAVLSARLIPDPTLALFAIVVGVTDGARPGARTAALGVPGAASRPRGGVRSRPEDRSTWCSSPSTATSASPSASTSDISAPASGPCCSPPDSSWAATRSPSRSPATSSARRLLLGSLEFLGPFEKNGWRLAGILVPVGYIFWSIWLVVIGIVLTLES